jgi:hypothetical protein
MKPAGRLVHIARLHLQARAVLASRADVKSLVAVTGSTQPEGLLE